MKAIITPVGTSLFDNLRENNSYINDFYEILKEPDRKEKDIKEYEEDSNNLKREISMVQLDEESCAEIKSLVKIIEKYPNEEIVVYLLPSDTILSTLAAEIIKEKLPHIVSRGIEKIEIKKVENLRINDIKTFIKGMQSLIDQVYSLANIHDWSNIILNITGGYKATIPYLTILGLINKAKINYIFEDMSSILDIPIIPVSQEILNYRILEDFYDQLDELSRGITNEIDINRIRNSNFYQNYSFLVWEYENLMELNPIGQIYFNKLKSRMILVRQEERDMIEGLNNDQRKLLSDHIRRLKFNLECGGRLNPDLDHYVNNYNPPEGYRIYRGRTNNNQVRILYKYENNVLKIAAIVLRAHINENDDHYVRVFRTRHSNIENGYSKYFI